MKPPPFAYAAPATLEEALGLLTEHAEAEPRVLAGGQSLIPLMNFRLAKPGYLVDLRNVAGLSGIRRDGDVLVIGAMTKMAEIERSPEVAVAAPLVTEAVGLDGDGDGDRIRRAALALAGVAPTPVRATAAERALAGAPADAATIRAAADAAATSLSPAGDLHASPETRRGLARTYLRRGIELAVARARNER